MKIQMMAIGELIPYINNPRQNDDAVDAVASSIKNFGFKVPIVIDGKNEIINGHTRLKAAKKLGLDEVPVIVADDLTPEQIKAFRLADNKVGELAEWDEDLLAIELEELENLDFDMEQFGFEELDFDEENEIIEDEFDEELPEEPKSKLGDVYQLGRHRLMCGDSTCQEHINQLLNGEKVNIVYTDPPYGMKKESDGVLNDNFNYDDLLEFNKKWVPVTFQAMKEVGSWYCWGIDEPLMDLYTNILRPMKSKNEITFRNLITWDKGSGQGQNSGLTRMYPTVDEKCLFVMKGTQGVNNNTDSYYEPFDAVRLKLVEAADRVGLTAKKLKEITGVDMYSHWFTKSQWALIPGKHLKSIAEYYGDEWTLELDGLKGGKKGIDTSDGYKKIEAQHKKIKDEYYSNRAYFDCTHENFNNVLRFNRTSAKERENTGGHATPKPLALVALMLKSSTRPEDTVLDVFGGSGSTLIACEQLGRICFMNELDPRYVDVIIHRWEEFTGKKAELVENINEHTTD